MYKVIVPTLNAASVWDSLQSSLLANVEPSNVVIVDSESTDGTAQLALSAGFEVVSIKRSEFNHGGTRLKAAEKFPDAEYLIYMTQDSVLAGPKSLILLLEPFHDPLVAASYGRQLPRQGAGAIESHARFFNYPAKSEIRSLASRERLGIRAAFLSNSLAAYRRSALFEVGGFRSDVIFGEDMIVSAKLLLADYKVAYVAEAVTYHSHDYSPLQDFKRYFDIGVMHSRDSWLIEEFGKAGGEGKRFVISELRYLLQRDNLRIPSALLRTALKFAGYQLGRREAKIPTYWKRRLSMHTRFWN
jgi:rhamnosyltransferase